MANNIRFDVDLNVKKQNLNELKQSLQEIQKITTSQFASMNRDQPFKQSQKELNEIQDTANQVREALEKAFNVDLGTVNIAKLGQELKNIGLDKVYNDFSKVGAVGNTAFRNLTTQLVTTNTQLKETNHVLDQMATTMANTVRWGITSSIMNEFTGAVQQAYGYVKHLDSSLNDIRIVTGKSADEMARFAETANDAAKRLGQGTTDYTRASLLYYQQGLQDAEVQARAETTLKAANVTGQSADTVSEQLTAVWNGYKVSAEETELYVDKLAAVAATTAADLEELSTGMSKVASAANAMGVDVDSLNAQLATIVSVTRQAPESVGTALRSIYARMSQLKADGTDEFGVTLGNYTSQMKSMGIEVLDATGDMRNMGDVIEEVAQKWNGWTQAQKNAAAQAMAGTRQYNNLVALFENWDMYTEALETSQNAMGTLQEQQDIYMESTEAHLQQVRTAFEGVADSLIDSDVINGFATIATGALTKIEDFIDTAGGGGHVLVGIFSSLAQVFNKQIASGITTLVNNMRIAEDNAKVLKAQLENINMTKNSASYQNDAGVKNIVDMADAATRYYRVMSEGEINTANSLVKQAADAKTLQLQWEENKKQALEYAKTLAQTSKAKNGNGNLYTEKDLRPDGGGRFYNIKNDIDTVNIALKNAQENIDKVSLSFSGIDRNAKVDKLIPKFKTLGQSIENTQTVIDRLKLDPKLVPAVKKFQDSLKDAGIEADKTGRNLQKSIAEAFKNGTLDEGKLTVLVSRLKEVGVIGDKEMQELAAVMGMTDEQIAKMTADVDNATNALKRFNEQQRTKALISGFTQLVGAASQVGFTLQSLSGIAEIWGDEGLTAGEKWNKTLSQLVMLAPGVIQSVSSITKGLELVSTATNLTMGQLGVLTGAVALLTAGIMYFTSHYKTSAEQLNSSVEEYTTTKKELEDLTTELETCHSRLKELYDLADQRTLTIAEQDELTNLEAQNAALEAQIELKKQLLETEQMQVARDAVRSVENGDFNQYKQKEVSYLDLAGQVSDVNFNAPGSRGLFTSDSQFITDIYNNDGGKKTIELDFVVDDKEILRLDEIAAGDVASLEEYHDYMESMIQQVTNQARGADETAQQYYANVLQQLTTAKDLSTLLLAQDTNDAYAENLTQSIEGYQKAMEILPALIAQNDENLYGETINTLEDIVAGYYQTAGKLEEVGQKIWSSVLPNQNVLDNLHDNLSEILVDAETNSINVQKLIATIGKDNYDSLKTWSDAYGISIYDLLTTLGELDLKLVDIKKKADDAQDAIQGKDDGTDSGSGGSGGSGITTSSTEEIPSFEDIYKQIQEQFDEIDIGSTIDKEAFDALNADMQSYFMEMQDGTYMLIKSANDFKEAADAAKTASLMQLRAEIQKNSQIAQYDIDDLSTKATGFEQAKTEGGKAVPVQGADLAATESQDTDKVREQIELIELLGTATEEQMAQIDEFKAALAEGDSLTVEQLKDLALIVSEQKGAYDAATGSINDQISSLYANEVALALTYDNIEDLTEAFKNGAISMEAYNVALAALQDKLDEDVDPEVAENLSDMLMEAATNADELGQALADDLEPDVADDLSESILRFDDAILDVVDNYEDWLDMLESGSVQDQADIMDDLADAYGDLLDIDGSSLSKEFLSSTDNLKLMQDAINGDIDAYDQLAAAAGQDIVAHLNLSKDDMANFTSELNNVQSMMDQMNFQDIEVGANLDTGNFLSALTNMVNAAGMTAEQATDYLASMGVDAEVEETTSTANEKNTETGWQAVLTPVHRKFSIPAIDEQGHVTPQEGTYTVQSLHYNPLPQESVNTKENKAFALKVTSAHKSSGGGFKFKQASNGGGAAGQARRGGSGGGGGGGGGGGKSYTPKKIDVKTEKSDRYHDVNLQLSKLSKNYDNLAKAEEKLTGKALIDNLNKQLKILEKQKDTIKEKQKIQAQEAKELKQTLTKQGFQFDDEGYISNYNKRLDKAYNKLSKLQKKYNKATTEESQKALDEKIKAQEERIERLESTSERYDELISEEMPDLEEQLQDIADQEVEINISKFNYSIQVRLDFDDALRDYNEFKEKVDKDFFTPRDENGNLFEDREGNLARGNRAFADFQSYWQDGVGDQSSIDQATAHVNEIMGEIEKMQRGEESSIFGKDIARAYEELQDWNSTLMDSLEGVEDAAEEVHDAYIDAIKEANDAFDNQIEIYDYIDDMIQHDMDVMGLLYGDEAYRQMANYYAQQEQNNLKELDFMKQRADYAKAQYDAETDPEAKEEWKQQWLDAQADVNKQLEKTLEDALDKYKNQVNLAFQELEDELSGGLGLDAIEDQWDLLEEHADEWLDPINALYGLTDLENKYRDAINDTDSTHNQKVLNDLMESELGMLREKDHLSQYDLDRANKKYEIALKQLALDNAQQNKSKMRLRRDSQGNYSYQFVEDQDQVDQARDELLKLQNDLYNMDLDRFNETGEKTLELARNLKEKLVELEEQKQQEIQAIRNDSTLSEEERQQRERDLIDHYSEEEQIIKSQYQDLIDANLEAHEDARYNLQDSTVNSLKENVYPKNIKAFNEMTGANAKDFEELVQMIEADPNRGMPKIVSTWDSGVDKMCKKMTGEGGFQPTFEGVFSKLKAATQEYQGLITIAAQTAGTDLSQLSDGYDANEKQVEELVEDNKTLIKKWESATDQAKKLWQQVKTLTEKYEQNKKAALDAAEAAIKMQKEMAKAAEEATKAQEEAAKAADAGTELKSTAGSKSSGGGGSSGGGSGSSGGGSGSGGSSGGGGRSGSGSGSSSSAGSSLAKDIVDSLAKGVTAAAVGTATGVITGNAAAGAAAGVAAARALTSKKSSYVPSKAGMPSDPSRYATGGYTGEWGSEGKLAVLDEKELVLNKVDTENILNAVAIMRDLNESMNSRVAGMLGGFHVGVGLRGGNNEIEQNVHITAEFPGVRDSKEIENALNNLINSASQYAFKTRP